MDEVISHFSWLPCFEYCQILIRCWRQTCHISVSHSCHQTFLMTKSNGTKRLILIEKSSNLHIKHFVFHLKSAFLTPFVFSLFLGVILSTGRPSGLWQTTPLLSFLSTVWWQNTWEANVANETDAGFDENIPKIIYFDVVCRDRNSLWTYRAFNHRHIAKS